MMLIIVLQINSNYFDGRFPRLDNCPLEHQLAKTRRIPSSNCSVLLDLTDRHCNTWFLSFRQSCKPCNFGRCSAHCRNISRRFLGLIYVWANPVPFHFVPACGTQDLRNNAKELKEVRLLNSAIISLPKILSFDDVMIHIAAMIQTMWLFV